MNDFYSSVYYPVVAFLNGENPHDRLRLKALYPEVEEYPPYLPLNLVLYLPFGLLPSKVAAIAYFLFSTLVTLLFSVFGAQAGGRLPQAPTSSARCRSALVLSTGPLGTHFWPERAPFSSRY